MVVQLLLSHFTQHDSIPALHGFPPPQVVEVVMPDCPDLTPREQARNRQVASQVIKDTLTKAQARIKHQADKIEPTGNFQLEIWSI
jgi:hypothetical protein